MNQTQEESWTERYDRARQMNSLHLSLGQELVLSGHLRAGAGTGDLHRCHFSGGLSDVSGRVASRRLRLGLYPEEVSGFEDRGVEVAQGPVRCAAAAVRDQRRAGIKRSFGA